MSFKNIERLQVYYNQKSNKLLIGNLAIKDRKIFFEYSTEFIATGLELSPFKLPLQTGVFLCEDQIFEGLFGVFNDSLPDGWGRLLLDRKLMQTGINPKELSALDRLRYVGSHGMGALIYEPEITDNSGHQISDLDQINHEIEHFQNTNDEKFIDDLIKINCSSGGARPKALIEIDDQYWLIKFRGAADPKDAGPIEYAYHLMAVDAKLDVPDARLFSSKNTSGFFGVKRFDRTKQQRFHMHTVSGLLHTDFRIPSLDYSDIIRATMWLTKDMREASKQFRVAVFNVLTYNRDDHAKNFSFLMSEDGVWKVSPSYDLCFSSGPGGEHSTSIMHESKAPKMSHLLQLAEIAGIDQTQAIQIIDEVRGAVNKWPQFADQAGVLKSSSSAIYAAITKVDKVIQTKFK